MIVALNAFAQGGKDTAALALIGRGFEQKAFADPLRAFVYAVNPIIAWNFFTPEGGSEFIRYADEIDRIGYEEVKRLYPEARDLLQRVGTEGGRKIIDDNVWVDAAFNGVEGNPDLVFTDCRFPNEADEVRRRGGKVIRIERPGLTAVNAHESETALLDYRFDYIINNDETVEVLQERILTYVDSVA